jgi:hypothetical protein
MNAIDVHRTALKWAFDLLELVTADVTQEQAHWHPPGIANPLGAQFAHAVCSTDAIIHLILQGNPPLYEITWADKCGVSEPRMDATAEWARTVQVDLTALRKYTKAVFNAADDFLAALTESELNEERDLTAAGMGIRNVDWILSALVTSHMNNMSGEISCLKGLQGAPGYPF